ncbi:unnamed protein product [Trichobilharzia regenti]|nr:unnamed protein product [Trichobilharzia regenti]
MVSSWNDALAFMRLAVEHDVSIRLLVCHTITPSALLRSEPDAASAVIHTVLDHVFELVEISPAEDTIEEGKKFSCSCYPVIFRSFMLISLIDLNLRSLGVGVPIQNFYYIV